MTLITPITKVRGPSTRGARPGIGTVNDRPRSGDHSCASGLRIGSIGGTIDGRSFSFAGRRVGRRHVGARRVVQRMAVGEAANLVGVENFARQQRVGDVHQPLLVLAEERRAALVLVADDALDLAVDLERGVFAVVGVLRDLAAEEDLLFLLAEGQRAHRFAHAPLADHAAGEVGGALEVVAGAGGDVAGRDLLGDAAAEQDADLVDQIVLRVVVLLVGRQRHGQAERHAARHDRHLVQRIGVRQQDAEQRVTGLVNRGDLLLVLGDDHRTPLGAHHHLVLGVLEVVHRDELLVLARRVERGLVHEVGEVRAGEADGAARQDLDVDIVGHRDLAGVHGEDAFAAAHVGTIHDHAAIETARAQQRRIEHVGPVGRRHQDDAFVRFEAVHLDQQLVQASARARRDRRRGRRRDDGRPRQSRR